MLTGSLSVPGLENANYDSQARLVYGLRPFRQKNTCAEREFRPHKRTGGHSRIVHSQGHGGAGFPSSFGYTLDVLELIEELEPGAGPLPTDSTLIRRALKFIELGLVSVITS